MNNPDAAPQIAILNKIHTAVEVLGNDMDYLKDDLIEIKSRLSIAEKRAEGALTGVEERLRRVEITQEGIKTKLMVTGGAGAVSGGGMLLIVQQLLQLSGG